MKSMLRWRVLLVTAAIAMFPFRFDEYPVADAVLVCSNLAKIVVGIYLLKRDSLLEAYLSYCRALVVFLIRNFYLLMIPMFSLALLDAWYLLIVYCVVADLWFLKTISDSNDRWPLNPLRVNLKGLFAK